MRDERANQLDVKSDEELCSTTTILAHHFATDTDLASAH